MKRFQSILVIDNDLASNYATKKFFNRIGKYDNLYFLKNGKEAMRFIELHFLPELILLDLDNPEVNGDEFMTQLRERELIHYTNLIIYSTQNTEQPNLIPKPLTYEKFCLAIGLTTASPELGA